MKKLILFAVLIAFLLPSFSFAADDCGQIGNLCPWKGDGTWTIGTTNKRYATSFFTDVDATTGTITTIDGTTFTFTTGNLTTLNVSGVGGFDGTMTTNGTLDVNGAITGDGGGAISGMVLTVTAKTANYSVTVAESQVLFTNAAAVGAVEFDLPADPTGLIFHFAVLATQNLVVNPADADQILSLTNAAGDSITEGTIGDTITLRGVSTSSWVAYLGIGAWPDTD